MKQWPILQTDAFWQIGGGAPSQPAPVVPTPTPPVSPDAQASVAAEQNLKRQQLRRKSISSTMYAAGGFTPNAGSGAGYGAGTGPNVGAGSTKTGGMT